MNGIDDLLARLEEEQIKKSHRRKITIKVIALLLVVIVLLLLIFTIFTQLKGNYGCKTELCVQTSADILRSLDNTVDPCDDFYAFTCGKLMENYRIADDIEELLNALIEESWQHSDSIEFQAQKKFYRKCLKLQDIDSDHDRGLLKLFDELGGWPILDKGFKRWDGWNYHWIDFAIKARGLGLKFEWFLEFTIHENTSFYYLKIDVPRHLLTPTGDVKNYRRDLIRDIAIYMGSSDLIDDDVDSIIEFERLLTMLAIKHSREVEWYESSRKLKTIEQVEHLAPSVIWRHFINDITERDMQISDLIVFNVDGYFKDLAELLQRVAKRHQVNYMMWKIVEDFWPFLSRNIRDRFKNYFLEIDNYKYYDRKEFCLSETKSQFPFLAQSVLIQRHVLPEKLRSVEEMSENIRKQLLKFLKKATWINEHGRNRAMDIINKVRVLPGGPEEIFENFRFYQDIGVEGFQFNSSNIIKMITERNLMNFSSRFSWIGQPSDKVRFNYYEQAINLKNFSTINREIIIVPTILLHDDVYNTKLPNYIAYASVGTAIAQEMFYLIFTGNDTYNNWWSLDILENNSQCLYAQNAKFNPGQSENPEDFNLGNVFSMELAHDAYLEWLGTHRENLPLPGLEHTSQQLFWILASQSFCHVLRKAEIRQNARTKLNGVLRNSYQFAKDYKCSTLLRMNPPKKCQLIKP